MRKTFFHDCAIISLNDTKRENSDTGRELIASVLKSSRRINFNLNDQSIRFDNQPLNKRRPRRRAAFEA